RTIFICELHHHGFILDCGLNASSKNFLGEFLNHTLDSFFGVPLSIPKLPKGSCHNHLSSDYKKEMKSLVGHDTFKTMRKEDKASRKERVALCENCRKEEESVKFMVCKDCKEKLDRRIFYCSA